jgi:hypothetical protein
MKKLLFLITLMLAVLLPTAGKSQVIVQFGHPAVIVPAAPACAYGYYDDPPYACAPMGYYDSSWFPGGIFLGAGPWFGGHYDRYYHGGYHYHGAYGGYSHYRSSVHIHSYGYGSHTTIVNHYHYHR